MRKLILSSLLGLALLGLSALPARACDPFCGASSRVFVSGFGGVAVSAGRPVFVNSGFGGAAIAVNAGGRRGGANVAVGGAGFVPFNAGGGNTTIINQNGRRNRVGR